MVRSSIFSDERYVIYECHVESGHAVTSGEAASNTITITDVEPHAVVITDKEYARGYADGELTAITEITYTSPATTVTFSSLTEGDIIDICFPVTGTGCGSLVSNINTGKLTNVRMQNMQDYNAESNLENVPECGTKRKEPIEFAALGRIVLGLNRFGNAAMADFVTAREGKSNGDEIYLLIDVVDSTVTPTTHDLLLEAKVIDYENQAVADDSIKGIVTDTIVFSFVPDVVML